MIAGTEPPSKITLSVHIKEGSAGGFNYSIHVVQQFIKIKDHHASIDQHRPTYPQITLTKEQYNTI